MKPSELRSRIVRVFSSISKRYASLCAPRFKPALQPAPVRSQQERGQAIIEMVLVLPLIFLFMLLIVDFGLALDRREVIQHDVREGARRGAVGASIAQVKEAASEVPGTFDVEVCYVDKDGNGNPGNAGDSVRVSGAYEHQLVIGSTELVQLFGADTGLTIMMTPSAESRLETSVAGANAC